MPDQASPDWGPYIVAIGGGKGGVGKSLVSGNVAVALADAGHRVVLVDADLGAANQHTLFGIERPAATLQNLIGSEAAGLDEIAMATRVPNLRLVVGTGAVAGAANINHGQKQKLLRHLRRIDADIVVVDVGAGTSHNVVDFFDAGDVRVVVVTPQLTSIQNAYAFLKAAVLRVFRHTAEDAGQVALLERATGLRETDRVDAILSRVQTEDAAFAERLREVVARFDARLVGNMVSESQDFGIFQGVARMVRDFLGVPLSVACHLRQSRFIHQSVNRRQPFLCAGVDDDNARILRRLAETLLRPPAAPMVVPRAGAAGRPAPDVPEKPEDLLRQHVRYVVSWNARLDRDGARLAARIVDVSEGGVGVETANALVPGDRWTLELLETLPSESIPVVVRHVGPVSSRAGLSFVAFGADAETRGRIIAAARQQHEQAAAATPERPQMLA